MITVTTAIVSNEWYFTYNEKTKEVIVKPNYVDSNTSAIIGNNVKIEVAENEQTLLDIIDNLGLITPNEET